MNPKIIFLLKALGIAMMFTSHFLFSMLFISAFYNGINTGNWISGININAYNEAYVELILFVFLGLPLGFYILNDYYHNVLKKHDEKYNSGENKNDTQSMSGM